MIHYYDSDKPVMPQRGDYLLYETKTSLLQYIRPNPAGKPIKWNNGDNKIILPSPLDVNALFAIGETLGGMFGFSAKADNRPIADNPTMRDDYQVVLFF